MNKIKNSLLNYLIILLVMIGLTSCFSKKYTRLARKYEEVELYNLAVDNYISSLQIKSKNNNHARVGLMRASQRYLDELEYKINEAYNALQDEKVVEYFKIFEDLKNTSVSYEIDLEISYKAVGQYEESKYRHLRSLYIQAQELLDKEEFQQAESYLIEVLKLDPSYERTKELYLFACSEPLYREAQLHIKNKRYRSAYARLLELEKIDAEYKDLVHLKMEAYQGSILTIAIQPAINESSFPHLSYEIEEAAKLQFVKANNPFLKIVAINHLQKILAEQRKALANDIPFDASMMIPVRVFLSGNILESRYQISKLEKRDRQAYLKQKDKRTGRESFKKVSYTERRQSATANIQYKYEFIRVEEGTIVANGKLQKSYTDNIQYAVSSYDVSNLYPFDVRRGISDTIYTNPSRVNAFRSQFSARNILTEKEYFEKEFAGYAAIEMYKKVNAYDPEK